MNTMRFAAIAAAASIFATACSTPTDSDSPLPHGDLGLAVAEVFETAGYDSSAANIRSECSGANPDLFNCTTITTVELALFAAFREHPPLSLAFRLLGEDAVADEYARCEAQRSTTGNPVRYGSYHCTEDALFQPVNIATWRSSETLASAFQSAGYSRSAQAIRRGCARSQTVVTCTSTMAIEVSFFPAARHHPTLVTAYRALGYNDLANEYQDCDSADRDTDCTYLLVDQAQQLTDRQLGLPGMDLTGDGMLSGSDLATAAGSGARFAAPLGASPMQQRVVGWFNTLAAGPALPLDQLDQLVPVFDLALAAAATTHQLDATP